MMQTQIKIYRPALAFIRRNWPLLLFGLAHAVIFLAIFQSGLYGHYFHDDFTLDYFYSSQIMQGHLPYRYFAVEYPPLAMLFITLPRLMVSSLSAYIWTYAVEMLIFDLIGLWVISRVGGKLGLNRWKVSGIYTIALLAIGPLITVRFDIIPAVITLLAVYAFMKDHHKTAWALLAVGMLVKIYPVIIAPLFLIYYLQRSRSLRHCEARETPPKQSQRLSLQRSLRLNSDSGYFIKRALSGISSFAVVSIIVLLPFLILSPSGLWHVLAYHMQRPLQIETVYASVLELLYSFKIITLNFVFSSGSVNVISEAADLLAEISFGVMVAGLLSVYWLFYRSLKDGAGARSWASMVSYSLLTILVFILTSKVLSPQYIIWILPFIPLVTGRWRNTVWLLFIMAGLMTFFVYPKYYAGIQHGELITVAMLAGRNLILILVAIMLINARQSSGSSHGDLTTL